MPFQDNRDSASGFHMGMKVEGFVGPWLCRYGKMKHAYQEVTGEEGWPGDPEIENAMARLLAIERGTAEV